jgi:hypothetical protein
MTDGHHSAQTRSLSTANKLEIIRRYYGLPRVNAREATLATAAKFLTLVVCSLRAVHPLRRVVPAQAAVSVLGPAGGYRAFADRRSVRRVQARPRFERSRSWLSRSANKDEISGGRSAKLVDVFARALLAEHWLSCENVLRGARGTRWTLLCFRRDGSLVTRGNATLEAPSDRRLGADAWLGPSVSCLGRNGASSDGLSVSCTECARLRSRDPCLWLGG